MLLSRDRHSLVTSPPFCLDCAKSEQNGGLATCSPTLDEAGVELVWSLVSLLEDSSRPRGEAESKLGLPLVYDKSYRINFSLLTPDLLEHSRKGKHSVRHSAGEHGGESLWASTSNKSSWALVHNVHWNAESLLVNSFLIFGKKDYLIVTLEGLTKYLPSICPMNLLLHVDAPALAVKLCLDWQLITVKYNLLWCIFYS